MKVLFTIWILAVIIQEVVPGTLVRLPRNALNRKSSVQTEYEAKYEQQGKHGHQSYSTVTGKQEIVHDDCGENWNAFAEKCATLIKDLIASLATAVKSNPGDATNLQLHIKNNFKHFDNTHNCTCLSHAGKGLKDLDLSPLFNNITITTSCPSSHDLSKKPEVMVPSGTPENPNINSNSKKVLVMTENTGINPEDADSFGENLTTNNRREVDTAPISSPGSVASSSTLPNGLQPQTSSATQLGSSPIGSENPAPILYNNMGPNNAMPAIESRESVPNVETQPQHFPGTSSNLYPKENIAQSGSDYPQGGVAQFLPSAIPGNEGAKEPSKVITAVPGTNAINGQVVQSPVTKPVALTEPSNQVVNPNVQNIKTPEENYDNSKLGFPADSSVEPSASQEPIAPVNPEMVQAAIPPANSISSEIPAPGTPESFPELTQNPTSSVTSEAVPGLSQQPAQPTTPEEALETPPSGTPFAETSTDEDCNETSPAAQIPSTLPIASQNSISPAVTGTPSVQPQQSLSPISPNNVASGTPLVQPQQSLNPISPDNVASGTPLVQPQQSLNSISPDNVASGTPLEQPQQSSSPISPNNVASGTPLEQPQQSLSPISPNNVASGTPLEQPQQSLSPISPDNVASGTPLVLPQQSLNPISPDNVASGTPLVQPQQSLSPISPDNVASGTPLVQPQQSLSPISPDNVASGTPLVLPQQSLNPISPDNVASGTPDQENCEDPESSDVVPAESQPPLSPVASDNGQVESPYLSQEQISPIEKSDTVPAGNFGQGSLNNNPVNSPILPEQQISPQQPSNSFGSLSQNPVPIEQRITPPNTVSQVVPIETPVPSNTPILPQQSLSPISSESVLPISQQTSNLGSPESTPEHNYESPGDLTNEPVAPVIQSNPLISEMPQAPTIGTSQDSLASAPVQPVPAVPQQLLNPNTPQAYGDPANNGNVNSAPVLSQGPVNSVNSEESNLGTNHVGPSLDQNPINPVDPSFSQSPIPPDLVQTSLNPVSSEAAPIAPENSVIQSPTAVNSIPPLTSGNHISKPANSGLENGSEDCEKSEPGAVLPESSGQLVSPKIPIKETSASPPTNVPVQPTNLSGSPNAASNPVPQASLPNAPLGEENCESPENSSKDSTAPKTVQTVKPSDPIITSNGPIQSSTSPETTTGTSKPPATGPVGNLTPLESGNQLEQSGSGAKLPTYSVNTPLAEISEPVAPLQTEDNLLPDDPSQPSNPSVVYQPQPVYPTAPSVPVDSLEEDEDLRPTTYQTTSVEPTRAQNPPILTIPLSHTVPPHSEEDVLPYRPSTSSHSCPKHAESGHEGDEEDEDCCSCESCTEEITNPNEYRANACKDLDDARRELKVIFDKIKKRLKCGKKFKPIPTTPTAADQTAVA